MSNRHLSDDDLSRRAAKLATYTVGTVVTVLCAYFADQSQVAFNDRQMERFRSELIIASAPAAIIMCEEDGTIIDLNVATEKIFGWQRDELLGKNTTVLIPDEMRQLHIDGMQRAAERARDLEPDNNWVVSKAELKVDALTRDNSTVPLIASIRVIVLTDGTIQFITYMREESVLNEDSITPLPSLQGQAAYERQVRSDNAALARNNQ